MSPSFPYLELARKRVQLQHGTQQFQEQMNELEKKSGTSLNTSSQRNPS